MQKAKRYYWSCSYPLGEGSIILPGNWGRMLQQYTLNDNIPNLLKEQIFETERLQSHLDKPSRFKSIFLCKDRESLKAFQRTGRRFDLSYEVSIVDDVKLFESNWELASLQNGDTYEAIQQRAKNYWTYDGDENIEIVTESRIKIIRQI